VLQVGDGPDQLQGGVWLYGELDDDLPGRLLIGECDILNCPGAGEFDEATCLLRKHTETLERMLQARGSGWKQTETHVRLCGL